MIVYMRAIEAKVLILLIFCACRRGLMERTRKHKVYGFRMIKGKIKAVER